VLVACMCRDEGVRRKAEDRMAERIPGAMASYKVLSSEDLRNREQAKAKVREQGFDGAIVMRLAGVDRSTTYVPGQAYVVPTGYGSMWGYWGYGWGTMYQPGYVEQNTVVEIETNLYSIAEDKLIWAGRSQTYDPQSAAQVIQEVVDATLAKMKHDKVLAT